MIVAIHGAIDGFDPTKISHRRMLPVEIFRLALQTLEYELVPVHRALNNRDVAVTIDDGTVAARTAAQLLAERDLPVTLFVNPRFVETEEAYPFVIVNAALEQSQQNVRWQGQQFDLSRDEDSETFRLTIKQELEGATCTEGQFEIVECLTDLLGVQPVPPDHLASLNLSQVRTLAESGVTIGNHGWEHTVSSEYDKNFFTNADRGAAWLAARFDPPIGFAVPYGRALPSKNIIRSLCGPYLLSDDRLRPGKLGRAIYNRLSIDSLESVEALNDRIREGLDHCAH